jgi:peptidoglycan/xylan/chitin deacetylase (PgdA/CDA1 family)
MPANEKVLYLTFDDGPVPGPTEFALDHLASVRVSATFFCIGDNIRKHPAIFKRIISGGHTVGNHSVNHVNGWRTPSEKYAANVRDFDMISAEAGLSRAARLFRPPYGRITRKQIGLLADFRIIMWDVLSHDYDQSLSAEKCLRGTINACRSGSIIVFHDSYKSQKNMEYTLPRLIDFFIGKGYSFQALTA